MIDGGPFRGSFKAMFVVDDQESINENIVDRLKSVVCIASVVESRAEICLQLIRPDSRAFGSVLNGQTGERFSLPCIVLRCPDDPSPDAPPQPVG